MTESSNQMNTQPFTENRPWGGYRVFVKNEPSTVKILFVKNGEAFSFQKHAQRDEFWRVLSGDPDITVGDDVIKAKVGDEFVINREVNHRISATINDVEVLEISTGDFDEEDIIRKEDKYGRI